MELTIFNAEFLVAALIVLVSGVLHGYTGFGGALLMVPLLAFRYGPVSAVFIAAAVGLIGSIQLTTSAARHAQWVELIPIFLGMAVFTPLGAYLLFTLDPQLVRRAMAVLIIAFSLALLAGWVYRGPRGAVPSGLAGALTGGIHGATGVAGPVLAIYFLSAPIAVESQRANIVIAVLVLIIATLASVSIGGGASVPKLVLAVTLAPVYVGGTWLGSTLFALAPKAYFKRVALWLLVVSGIGIAVA